MDWRGTRSGPWRFLSGLVDVSVGFWVVGWARSGLAKPMEVVMLWWWAGPVEGAGSGVVLKGPGASCWCSGLVVFSGWSSVQCGLGCLSTKCHILQRLAKHPYCLLPQVGVVVQMLWGDCWVVSNVHVRES